ncbi:MAG TPA: hypothetical protein VN698_16935 [Bacteroidia bacterium]|nr:hypothetical protein [Bacteroidia bacterium]
MKTQNQTPEKSSSHEIGKGQSKVSPKRTADEKPEQNANKLGTKKTMQPDEKMKSNKGAKR